MLHRRNRSGFTLAELLIVVAIIAVLVAIAIPIFTNQLEKSREAKDLSNVRGAYAEVIEAAMTDDNAAKFNDEKIKQSDGSFEAVVALEQKVKDWQMDGDKLEIGGISSANWIGLPMPEGSCTIQVFPETDSIRFIWRGGKVLDYRGQYYVNDTYFPPLTDEQRANAIEMPWKPSEKIETHSGNAGGKPTFTIENYANGTREHVEAVPGVVYDLHGVYLISDGQCWFEWGENTKKWYHD